MPFTTLKVIEGVFSKEQKAKLIEKITEAEIRVRECATRPGLSLKKSNGGIER